MYQCVCDNTKLNDVSAKCSQHEDAVAGIATIHNFNNKGYCSLLCITDYLNKNNKIEKYEYTGNEDITQCNYCNEKFLVGDTILKYNGHFFCSEACIEDYLD